MNRLLFCLVVFCLAFSGCDKWYLEKDYMEKAVDAYMETPSNVPKALSILGRGIDVYPDSFSLLQFRSSLHCSFGYLVECRQDLTRLLQLRPEVVEIQLGLCMLDEFEGVGTGLECYRDVVAKMPEPPAANNQDEEVFYAFSRLFARLMAEEPGVEEEKAAFLRSVAEREDAKMYTDLLESFDRKAFIHDFFKK